MTKKILALTDYISAWQAALILSQKLGREIKPGYIHKLRDVRSIVINATTKLYYKPDIELAQVKQKRQPGA